MTPGHAFYSPLASDVGGSLNWIFFAAGPVLAGFETVTPLETVTALWRLANEPDATVESVVGAIPTRGPDAVESFVVAVIGERVTIVTRGSASVDVVTVGGQRRIDSRQMQPWYLAEFDGVMGLSLGSDARSVGVVTAPDSGDLPLLSGLVRAPWLAWTSGEVGPGRDERSARAEGSPRRAAAAAADSGSPAHQPSAPITGSIPVQNLAASPGPYRMAITTPIPVIPAMPGAFFSADAPSGPVVTPSSPSRAIEEPADLDDTVKGLGTGRWSLAEEEERAARLAAASDLAGDIGDTIAVATDRQRHRADVPTVTAWSPGRMDLDPRFAPGAAQSVGFYCFRIGGGPVFRLDTPVYIGRKPSSPRIVTGTIPRLLKVTSPSMEVSGTHVELRQEGTTVVVTDMRSTNGTFVSQPGSEHLKLRQGESLVVTPGTLVDIGDGNVIEILPIR